MKIGAVFPNTEISADPDIVAEFATTAERLGYNHLVTYDHVLGAGRGTRPDWDGSYDSENPFHETFVLFGYLAGLTSTIELVSAIVILPQRQTALVAKQAACADVFSNGRLRLGFGTGWNEVEYEALSENFHNRGKRSEEQIEVMRRLWAEETVTFNGKWHTITDAGINPLPPTRSIPVWLGGDAPPVLERVGRMADGWIPIFNRNLEEQIATIHQSARDNGRDPNDIGIECHTFRTDRERQRDRIKKVQDLGVTHTAIGCMDQGLSPREHIDAIKRIWDDIGDLAD